VTEYSDFIRLCFRAIPWNSSFVPSSTAVVKTSNYKVKVKVKFTPKPATIKTDGE
jgi:hypothetical protein